MKVFSTSRMGCRRRMYTLCLPDAYLVLTSLSFVIIISHQSVRSSSLCPRESRRRADLSEGTVLHIAKPCRAPRRWGARFPDRSTRRSYNSSIDAVQRVFAIGKPPEGKICFFQGLKNVVVLPAQGDEHRVFMLNGLD